MDWFTVLICLIIGFILGRLYPLAKKFSKFLENETNKRGDKDRI
jgi:hypothetical protein